MSCTPAPTDLQTHRIASRQDWTAERLRLLEQEKELTRLRDRIAAERRALPWVRMDKDYVFDTPGGRRPLGELFEGRSQLLVQHFMLGPGWEQGCPSCSYMADHLGGIEPHLQQRDTTLVLVSRAPLAEIERFRQRMGWPYRWVSSHGNDFNFDFGVSFTPQQRAGGTVDYNYRQQPFPHEEAPGISVFYRNRAGEVFHTYSTYGRGVEAMMGTYDLVDLTPRGRDEQFPMDWVRHHDCYEPQLRSASVASADSPQASQAAMPSAADETATTSPCCHGRD